MTMVDIGDGELWTDQSGEGEPVLLVPGLGGRAAFWGQVSGRLAQHFRVVLHDHRGAGKSTRAKMIYSVPQMADDVLRLMDGLGIERAHLVGHSTGGAVGQQIALDHPDRLRKLVISGSWAGPDPLFLQLFKTRQEILQKCGPEAYLMVGTALAQPGAWLQQRFGDARAFFEERLRDFPGEEIEVARIAAVTAHDLRARVGQITAPTRVIGARDDNITPPGLQEELARLIPGADLVMMDFGGHFAPITNPDVYVQAVLPFLQEGDA